MLDADDNPLKDRQGATMFRDIVQFLPLKKFGNEEISLVSEGSVYIHKNFKADLANFYRLKKHWQRFLINFSHT